MAPKKAPMKPPIKRASDVSAPSTTNASPTPSTSAVRGRNGPSSALPDRPQVTQLPSTVDVEISVLSQLEVNCVQVPPTIMRKLGLTPGGLVLIETNADKIVCEVAHGTQVSNHCIGVAATTAALLVDTSGDMSNALLHVKSIPIGASLLLVVLPPKEEQIHAYAGAMRKITMQQIEAAFRLRFQHHVVFHGMICDLRIATFTFRVEVMRIDVVGSQDAKFAMITQSTVISSTRAQADEIDDYTDDHCDADSVSAITESTPWRHRLIVGDSGTGKSYRLTKEVEKRQLERPTLRVFTLAVAEFIFRNARGSITNATAIRDFFREATSFAPSLIVVDDLHLLCPAHPSPSIATPWAAASTSQAWISAMDEISSSDVTVIATSVDVESLDASITAPHRLGGIVIRLEPPSNAKERMEVLQNIFSNKQQSVSDDAFQGALQSIANTAHGCSQRDLSRLWSHVLAACFERTGESHFSVADLENAAKRLRPSALRNMEVTIPNMSWSDIGGSDVAKHALQECVDWCLGKNKWIFEKFHLSPPKGVLLYGPPGCSKTMLAKALANEAKMNFISVKGPEVFSKWVGDSEKAVREIFRKARAAAPCVVFVDELDGMCGHRGSGGVSDRVISQFLTELDGLPAAMSSKTDSIIFVAATNRPENIDGAVLRPGRIDRKVYVGLPEQSERCDIAKLHLTKMPRDEVTVTPEFVAERTEGYSGAEVVAVCKEAAFHALERDINASRVERGDVESALQKIRPRISAKEVLWYQQWAQSKV